MPTDPFPELPFRYERQDGSFYLYSIGPDLRDDGGKVDYDQVRRAQQGETGDIIFKAPA